METNDEIRVLLAQAISNAGIMSWNRFIEVLGEICNNHDQLPPTETSAKEYVRAINKTLKPIKSELTIFQYPIEKEEYVVFSMPIDVQNPELNAAERSFFNKLLGEVVSSLDYCIPYLSAYNVLSGNPNVKLQKMRMQNLVKHWTVSGYFHLKDDNLYLGPRAMIEYRMQFGDRYKDNIFKCPLCGEITFWQICCRNCSVRFHDGCIQKWLEKNSNCFSCKKKWIDASQ